MKNKLVIVLVCILLMGGFGYYLFSKQETKKEKKIDTTKYEGYTFYDVEEKETKKGEAVYNIDDYVTYSDTQSIKVNSYCIYKDEEDGSGYVCEFSEENGEIHTYSIVDGKVKYTTDKGQSYTFKKINNAMFLQFHTDGMDATTIMIEVLTNNGKVYRMDDCPYGERIKNEDDVLKYSNIEGFKIEKMGVTNRVISFEPEVILKTMDGKYLRLNEENHQITESNEFYSRYGVVVDRNAFSAILDEKGNNLSVFMIMSAHDGADHSYILTREGYLYKLNSDDFNSTNSKHKTRRYVDKKVKKIGTSQEEASVIVIFDDGEELKLSGYSLYNLENLGEEH